ncbi:MAG: gamma carbonic anhydrase family protein [Methanophagales archaeon ANME-1-THS]|nr:MAG: gamma carbonic anhydrase family protein [Methanophagales archaeon ANME-1-THS]
MRGFEGFNPKLGEPVYIDPLSVVIGNVELGDHVSIWPHAVIRGDPYAIHIGSWTNIQDNCVVHGDMNHDTWIGEYGVVGHGAILHGCRIEDGCMVGMGSIILNGVTVGAGCIIGAGTLLTPGKTFPPGSMILGSPGDVVRDLSPEEIAGIRAAARYYWEKALGHMRQQL